MGGLLCLLSVRSEADQARHSDKDAHTGTLDLCLMLHQLHHGHRTDPCDGTRPVPSRERLGGRIWLCFLVHGWMHDIHVLHHWRVPARQRKDRAPRTSWQQEVSFFKLSIFSLLFFFFLLL